MNQEEKQQAAIKWWKQGDAQLGMTTEMRMYLTNKYFGHRDTSISDEAILAIWRAEHIIKINA